VVKRLTVLWEIPGSNSTVGSCVYHDNQFDTACGYRLHNLNSVHRLTQLSTLHGMVQWVSAFGLN